MDLTKILSINPETLAQEQHDALLKDTISKLDRIKSLLVNHDYKAVFEMCEESPSGDCMGCDNYFINFHYGDIVDTAIQLQNLSDYANINHTRIPRSL